ncbi:hypothetical protein GCM10010412_098410 [Nonomuraea recticatena]|uniref:Uncharacterized protein n=1 Tax=Nonomuraea recticatena TaxID=46178 RepID=A0ABN3TEY8_9ACTN
MSDIGYVLLAFSQGGNPGVVNKFVDGCRLGHGYRIARLRRLGGGYDLFGDSSWLDIDRL